MGCRPRQETAAGSLYLHPTRTHTDSASLQPRVRCAFQKALGPAPEEPNQLDSGAAAQRAGSKQGHSMYTKHRRLQGSHRWVRSETCVRLGTKPEDKQAHRDQHSPELASEQPKRTADREAVWEGDLVPGPCPRTSCVALSESFGGSGPVSSRVT